MSEIALIHPTNLVAVELRESLERRRDLWEAMSLFSSVEDEIGTLTDVRGEAAMVQAFNASSLNGVDVAFFSSPMANNRAILDQRSKDTAAVILSPDAAPDDGYPIVAGVNLAAAHRDRPLISAHPATILLANLLYPLLPFEPQAVAATVMQPVSMFDKEGLDEVLDQTRSILNFGAEQPRNVFDHQMVFNMVPAKASASDLESQLATVLDEAFPVSMQLIQAGVFHSFSASVHLHLAKDPGVEALRQAVAAHSPNELAEAPEVLGPITAAASDNVLVGEIEPAAGGEGRYRCWCVMDNLTCGGALNAIQILEAISQQAAQ